MARKKKAPATPAQRQFKSPIEVMLRNGIVQAAASQRVCLYDHSTDPRRASVAFHGQHRIIQVEGPEESEEWGIHNDDDIDEMWSLYGEVKINAYSVDFLLQPQTGYIAIECDGHEYHDRTKQQAAYDRARDRDLLRLGITTIRFTGSEIHHSIDRCVADIYDIGRLVHSNGDATLRAWQSGSDHERNLSAADLRLARCQQTWVAAGADNRHKDGGALRGVLSGVI